MLLIALGTIVILQEQAPKQTTPPQKASEVISKMLAHYDSAQSISGSILLTQAAKDVTLQIKTELQFDKPSKIYLRQTMGSTASSPTQQWFLNSNGVVFSYSKADNVLGPAVLRERVTQNGFQQDVRALYSAVRPALKDPNALLELAIGRPIDQKALMAQWATMKVSGQVSLNGVQLTAITGTYRMDQNQAPSGSFEAYFDSDYNFVKYVLRQKFAVPGQIDQIVSVVSTWDSDLKVNAKTNPTLYTG